jgi:hypothetical protein
MFFFLGFGRSFLAGHGDGCFFGSWLVASNPSARFTLDMVLAMTEVFVMFMRVSMSRLVLFLSGAFFPRANRRELRFGDALWPWRLESEVGLRGDVAGWTWLHSVSLSDGVLSGSPK